MQVHRARIEKPFKIEEKENDEGNHSNGAGDGIGGSDVESGQRKLEAFLEQILGAAGERGMLEADFQGKEGLRKQLEQSPVPAERFRWHLRKRVADPVVIKRQNPVQSSAANPMS